MDVRTSISVTARLNIVSFGQHRIGQCCERILGGIDDLHGLLEFDGNASCERLHIVSASDVFKSVVSRTQTALKNMAAQIWAKRLELSSRNAIQSNLAAGIHS